MGNDTSSNAKPKTGFLSRLSCSGLGRFFTSLKPKKDNGKSPEKREASSNDTTTIVATSTPTQTPSPTPFEPQHAKESFLKTATSHQMSANEDDDVDDCHASSSSPS